MKHRHAFILIIASLFFFVGCAGGSKERVKSLEKELAECKDAQTQLNNENEKLKSKNAELQRSAEAAAKLAESRKKIYDDLRASLQELIDAGSLKVTLRGGLIVLQMPNRVLFESGSAAVKSEAEETLKNVATALAKLEKRRFFVAGHTDNQPIKKKKAQKYADNWDLSAKRAYNVRKVLSSAGLSDSSTALVALADTDPVADNSSEEGRTENRRIEIMVMPNLEAILPAIATK